MSKIHIGSKNRKLSTVSYSAAGEKLHCHPAFGGIFTKLPHTNINQVYHFKSCRTSKEVLSVAHLLSFFFLPSQVHCLSKSDCTLWTDSAAKMHHSQLGAVLRYETHVN